MLDFLAQSAPPVELSMTKMRAGIGGAIAGGMMAFQQDLNAYLKREAGTAWDWRHTAARVGSGALTGAMIAVGLLASPI